MAETNCNDEAYAAVFYQSLSTRLKDNLVSRNRPELLEDLIALAIKVDTHHREQQSDKERSKSFLPGLAPLFQRPLLPNPVTPSPVTPSEEPILIGRIGRMRLSRKEKSSGDIRLVYAYIVVKKPILPMKLGGSLSSGRTGEFYLAGIKLAPQNDSH